MVKSKKPNKKQPSWEKVKISGNLVSNDGGGLEGLIGLEVLEDYDQNIISEGGSGKVCVNIKITIKHKWSQMIWFQRKYENSGDDEKIELNKKRKNSDNKKTNETKATAPGKFVLLKRKKKSEGEKNGKEPCTEEDNESEADTDVLTSDDLVVISHINII